MMNRESQLLQNYKSEIKRRYALMLAIEMQIIYLIMSVKTERMPMIFSVFKISFEDIME